MQKRRVGAAAAVAAALTLSTLAVGSGAGSAAPATSASAATAHSFHRVATYPVFQNVPDGVDPAAATVAEISTVTEDGKTVIYTDALGKRAGFLDITNPAKPRGLGSIDLTQTGHADDQPTSVAVAGNYLLVVVDTTAGDFANPSGRLDVFDLASNRAHLRSIDLAGQPDSIAISPDGGYAAIAMENQRDEEATPAGGNEGDLPQAPAGFVQVVALTGAPAAWTPSPIALTNTDGSALPSFLAAGIESPTDPEPEYVDINGDNQLVLTLQENNGVVVIDLPSKQITKVFSAGNAQVTGVDTKKDGLFDPTGSLDLPREPDAVQWVGDGLVATANEGDWKGGTRGWTVFDASTGAVVWDAGNSFEKIATRHGLHNNDRAAKKGSEPEGLAFAEIGGKPRAFVGSERSNFVAVYDMSNPRSPRFEQILPTTNGPEGLLPVPQRNLLVVASETDDAAINVRASVGLYQLGKGQPAFPSVASADVEGQPIGWGALSALSADPKSGSRIYSASDSAYATGRIYSINTARTPAVIDKVIEVTDAEGAKPKIDIEGLHARKGGGFWLALEGASGPENKLVRTDAAGKIQQTVELPAEITAGLGKQGLEGVSSWGTGSQETVFVTLQREAADENFVRIGRYQVSTGTWSWFAYSLEKTMVEGDWIGLSEITALSADVVSVIERDKLNGPRAKVKRIYTVDLAAASKSTVGSVLPARPVRKRLAVDLLPYLRSDAGWTQEKVEGFTISGSGQVFAVTDNDGLKDATGETQLFRLGTASKVFAKELRTSATVKAKKRTVRKGHRVVVKVKVTAAQAAQLSGKVKVLSKGRTLGTATLKSNGTATLKIKANKRGKLKLRATFTGSAFAAPSTSRTLTFRVR
ncbi:esterase-like activity of phytase family protein [Nocardioides sp. Bht2]|uniref:esterase-like activity of phytase family protein n=1 Tax=Nocardioides sp. Bht2 TaxID=3392297 RepID=UPI0039B5C520